MTGTPPSTDPPTPTRVRYGPGEGTAVAGPASVGLVQGTPDDPAVSAIVDALLSGADIDDLLDCLAALGIRSLPGFAIAFVEGQDVRLLIRGAATAHVGHAADATFTGAGATSWFETVVDSGPLTMRIPGPTAERATFVLVAGSAPASVIDFDAATTPAGPPSPRSPRPVPSPPPSDPTGTAPPAVAELGVLEPVDPNPVGREHFDPEPDDPEPGDPEAGDTDDATPGDPVVRRPAAPFASAAPVAPVAPRRAPVTNRLAVNPPVPPDAPATGLVSEDIDFGHLLGATVYRTVEAAAVRPDDEVDEVDEAPGPERRDEATDANDVEEPTALDPISAPDEPRFDEALDPEEPPTSFETRVYDAIDPPLPATPDPASGLISAVPGMAATRAEQGERFTPVTSPMVSADPHPGPVRSPASSTEPSGSLGSTSTFSTAVPTASMPLPPTSVEPVEPDDQEPDSHTISVADLRARQAASAPPTGATVQAVHCAAMHPNPPHSDRCRSCAAQILDHSVRRISRPSLGELSFDDGQIVPLDRPVVVGRKPAAGALVGGETARAVRLSDPDSLLSRTHLEVRLVDWQVQIVDRDSMNHTFVALPGKPPTQLRPAEPFPIPPGTIVRLGDAASFTYKVGS